MAIANEKVGRYLLRNPLGAGGMGEVWKAYDELFDHEVALIIVRSEHDPTHRLALVQEIASMKNLPGHQNLVSLLDVVEEGGAPSGIVMEYVPGPTLKEVLENYPDGLPWNLIAPLVEGLLNGLGHVHNNLIIHRDLKPGNIKLQRYDGAKPFRATQVKLLDFGLARIKQNEDTEFTRGGAGTCVYMSPEQLRREPQAVPTDIYAFGVLLFEISCGHPPFFGSIAAICEGHTNQIPPLISSQRSNVPEELDLAVKQALSKRMTDRPASTEVLLNLLQPCLDVLAASAEGHSIPGLNPPIRPSETITQNHLKLYRTMNKNLLL
jgi:serine/threonine protein kinase